MKTFGMWAGLMLGLSVASMAVAADAAKPKKEFSEKQLAQQQRMKDCSADAKGKAIKGDDRKAFMKTCLSNGSATATAGSAAATAPAAAAPVASAAAVAVSGDKGAAQRDKMKTCNADAKTQALKGDPRKKFMSECLAK